MIEISVPDFFTLFTLISVGILLILWGRSIWLVITKNWQNSTKTLNRCPSCHYAFLISAQATETTCPSCKQEIKVKYRRQKYLRY